LGLKDKLKGVLLFYRRRAKYKPKPKNLRRSLALDKAKTAKTVYDKPPKNWNPKKSDVRGIDAPEKNGKIAQILKKLKNPRGKHLEKTYYQKYWESKSGKKYITVGWRIWNAKKKMVTAEEKADIKIWEENGKVYGKIYAKRPGMEGFAREQAKKLRIIIKK